MMAGMLRTSMPFICQVAVTLDQAKPLDRDATINDCVLASYPLRIKLYDLFHSSAYGHLLRVCKHSGQELITNADKLFDSDNWGDQVDVITSLAYNQALDTFKVTFLAELGTLNLYLVTQKRGYDIFSLIEDAATIFPPDLLEKVPEAGFDITEAGKCIAFELTTAAGFHLARALELVVLRYWNSLTSGEELPTNRNLGNYITLMEAKKVAGTEKALAALRQIKDLHRNPLMHPDESLTLDECIAFLNIVQGAMVAMLPLLPSSQPASEA